MGHKTDFTILNFLLGVTAVLATVLVPFVVRRSKRLVYDVLCEAWIIEKTDRKDTESSEESADEGRRILFVIDIRNPLWGIFSWLGGVDIAPSQYERKVAFSFGEEARIVEAEIVGENPSDLGAELIAPYFPPYYFFPDNKVVLKPILLNQGDSFRLRVVVENPAVEHYPAWFGRNSVLLKSSGFFTLRPEGRIFGIRQIQRKRGFQELFSYGLVLTGAAILPLTVVFVPGLIVWFLTGNPDLMNAAPLPSFFTPLPGTSPLEPLTILTGAQSALLATGQFFLILAARRRLKAREIAKQYSPPSSWPLPVN